MRLRAPRAEEEGGSSGQSVSSFKKQIQVESYCLSSSGEGRAEWSVSEGRSL